MADVLKVKAPVGEGGWMTSRREVRLSIPNFMEWRPRVKAAVSAISVTSVRKDEAIFAGGPSCWKPAIEKIGSSLSKVPFVGMPGMPRSSDGEEASLRAERLTVRRV